jgi:hypothetical protein
MVAHNELHLSAIVLLAPHLTQANHDELLSAARHRSKREVERLLAERFPQPDAPEEIRRLPRPSAKERAIEQGVSPATRLAGPTRSPQPEPRVEAQGAAAHPPRPEVVQPTAPERYKVQFTASASLHDKLREAQALLRHQIKDGNVAELMELALDALLEKTKKRRFAATERPRSNATKTKRRTRQIPSAVRRAVFERDGGRCTFEDADGNRCNETSFIEFHHILPFACGGQHSVENITLRCKGHNRLAAEKELGPDAVAAKIREARASQRARKGREAGASTAAAQETAPRDGAPSGRSPPGSQLAWLTPAPLHEPRVPYGQRLRAQNQSPPEVTFISAGRGAMATSHGASAKVRYGG